MKDFLAGWIVFQLIVIGIFTPFAWNMDTPCDMPPPKMGIVAQLIITVTPLYWFISDFETPCIK